MSSGKSSGPRKRHAESNGSGNRRVFDLKPHTAATPPERRHSARLESVSELVPVGATPSVRNVKDFAVVVAHTNQIVCRCRVHLWSLTVLIMES